MSDLDNDAAKPLADNSEASAKTGAEAAPLSEPLIKALKWMRDFPSHRARWTNSKGKSPKGLPVDGDWTHLEISGDDGSLRISQDDLKAISKLIMHCTGDHKMYDISDDARALLARASNGS